MDERVAWFVGIDLNIGDIEGLDLVLVERLQQAGVTSVEDLARWTPAEYPEGIPTPIVAEAVDKARLLAGVPRPPVPDPRAGDASWFGRMRGLLKRVDDGN